MKIAQRNVVLGALCVVLGAAHLLAERGRSERAVERLFPAFLPVLASRVRIESGDGARAIELARTDAEWVLPEALDHPARTTRVQLLLDRVSALTDVDLVADRAADHGDYGVGEGALVLRVFAADGAVLAALVQGKEAPAGPGDRTRATYVRPLGADEVFRAARLEPLELDPLAWLDSRWLALDPLAVRVLRLRGSEVGEEPVERRAERGWSGAARELLEYARGMFFEAVLGRDAELPPAVLEIELELAGEESIVLGFAAAAEDGSRLAWRSDSAWLVRFAGSMVEPLIERARQVARSKP